MYPVFIKSGYRHFLLQYGKRVATSSFSFTSSILRFANDDSKSKSDDDDIKVSLNFRIKISFANPYTKCFVCSFRRNRLPAACPVVLTVYGLNMPKQ